MQIFQRPLASQDRFDESNVAKEEQMTFYISWNLWTLLISLQTIYNNKKEFILAPYLNAGLFNLSFYDDLIQS